MGRGRALTWGDYQCDADGLYSRSCLWCGSVFRASRRDAQLCSSSCRTASSRYEARRAAFVRHVLALKCLQCGSVMDVQRRTKRYCSDSCRARARRLRQYDDDRPERPARLRGIRPCHGPKCTTVFVLNTGPGHPKRFCSARCRAAAWRAELQLTFATAHQQPRSPRNHSPRSAVR